MLSSPHCGHVTWYMSIPIVQPASCVQCGNSRRQCASQLSGLRAASVHANSQWQCSHLWTLANSSFSTRTKHIVATHVAFIRFCLTKCCQPPINFTHQQFQLLSPEFPWFDNDNSLNVYSPMLFRPCSCKLSLPCHGITLEIGCALCMSSTCHRPFHHYIDSVVIVLYNSLLR